MADHLEFEHATGHEHLGGGHHEAELVAAHAMPGTAASVLFTPTKAGVYDFACTLPHLRNILDKLHLDNRAQVMAYAGRHGLGGPQ